MIEQYNTEYSPVIIFAYNRVNHLRKCIEALEKNNLTEQSILYVFADQAVPGDSKQESVTEVRDYLGNYLGKTTFKRIQIIAAEKHKGLAKSVIDGVTDIINIYGKAIVVEDDVIVSPDFLQFMNDALEFYKDNGMVWSITGVGYDLKSLKEYKPYVYLSYRGGSECWATWKDRWNLVDWDMDYYDSFSRSIVQRYRFNRGGNDLTKILKMQKKGLIDSWAIRWDFSQFSHNMMTITPRESFMYNVGFDGHGTHCTEDDPFRHRIKSDYYNFCLENVEPNKRILRDYKRVFSTNVFQSIQNRIKTFNKNKR